MSLMNSFYQLYENHPLLHWGDYGSVLVSGIVDVAEDGQVTLSRSGPFIPPVSMPFCIIITDNLKKELESACFSGFTLHPVTKGMIVDLNWVDWDFNADDPPFYPDSGSPEDYIFTGLCNCRGHGVVHCQGRRLDCI